MAILRKLAVDVWADFKVPGQPSQGEYEPVKAEAADWGTWVESLAMLAFTSSLVYTTKAALIANLVPAANVPAIVANDPTPGNNGLYMKVGATTTGSWTQLTDYVPGSQIVTASDAGAGSANAIEVTTNIAVSPLGNQLIISNIFRTNTATPVTIRFSGAGTVYTIKTASGLNPAIASLPPRVMGIISGANFILASDLSSSAVQAACEAALAAAANFAAQAAIGPNFEVLDRAALLANTSYTYAAGAGQVTAGVIIRTRTGFAYEVATSGASNHHITTAGGVKLYALYRDNVINLFQRGANGNGATNDATLINLLNVANTVIDLDGRDYAYTGTFSPLALFRNGRIISSVSGTFNYLVTTIATDITVTVGAVGTFKFLKAALDWTKSLTITTGTITFSLLEHNTPDTSAGSMAFSSYMWGHVNTNRMAFSGPALSGAHPTSADMTGVRATDEAFLKTRYGASIYLHGSDDLIGSFGLAIPNGLLGWDNVGIVSRTRYSLDIGYNGSHGVSTSGKSIRFNGIFISGGVWGIVASMASMPFSGPAIFCHQISGGPIDMIGGLARAETADIHFYTPPGVKAADAPKYGLYLENGAKFLFTAGRCKMFGSFLHGVMLKHAGCELQAESSTFDGLANIVTAEPGSLANIRLSTIQNGDKANIALVAGGTQVGYFDNNGANACVHAGLGASVSVGGCTVTNMVNSYFAHAIGGLIVGLSSVTVTDHRWTAAYYRLYGSASNYLAANLSLPKSSSLDQCVLLAISTCRVGTNVGLSFSPAIGTLTNGNLFTNVG